MDDIQHPTEFTIPERSSVNMYNAQKEREAMSVVLMQIQVLTTVVFNLVDRVNQLSAMKPSNRRSTPKVVTDVPKASE